MQGDRKIKLITKNLKKEEEKNSQEQEMRFKKQQKPSCNTQQLAISNV